MTDGFEPLYRNTLLAVLLALLAMERLHRAQRRPAAAATRWFPNLSLFVLGGLIGRLVYPTSLVVLAASADAAGLLAHVPLPWLLECALGFLALDLLSYGLHRLSHHHPLLWRAHLVHHTDVQVDVTTSVRHHPIEVLVNGGLMAALVVVLGLPWQAVGAYLVAALVVAAWSHANLRWPPWLESALGLVFVTPGIHVQHHSAQREQTDSNYGTVFSFWDRLFGSFTPHQAAPPPALGLEYFRRPQDNTLGAVLLRQPFVRRLPAAQDPSTWSTPVPSRAPALPAPWREALQRLALGLCLLVPVLAPTALTLTAQWSLIEAFRYAWLVLPMLVYAFGWHWREALLASTPRPSGAGALVVLLGALGWALADLLNIELGRQLTLVLMVLGVVLAAVGPALVRQWFAVLALLFYMVPSSDLLQPLLRWLTTEGLALTLSALNLPVRAEGFLLHVGGNRYFVAEACSGLAYVTLLAFLGHALGMLVYRSLWRVLAMALLGAVLGVLTNLVRVNAIVLIDLWRGTQMDLAAHGHVQWISLVVALALMLLVVARSRAEPAPSVRVNAPVPRAAASDTPLATHPATLAGLAGLVVIGACSLVIGLAAHTSAPLSASMLPSSLAGWTRSHTDATPPTAGGHAVASAHYQRGGQRLRLDLLQANSHRDKLSPQSIAPADDAQWQAIRREALTACATDPCVPVLHTVKRLTASAPMRHVYLVHGVGDTLTVSQLRLRAATAWHTLTRHPVGPYVIALSVEGDELAPEELQRLLRGAIEALGAHRGAP